MEDVQKQEQPKPQTEQEPPKTQSIVISANGLIIKSKLNPEAKEFYPSYLHQLQYKKTDVPEQSAEIPQKVPAKLTVLLEVKGSKELKEDIVTYNQEVKMTLETHESGHKEIIESITDKIGETKEMKQIRAEEIKDVKEETANDFEVEKPLVKTVEQPKKQTCKPEVINDFKDLIEELADFDKIDATVEKEKIKNVIECPADEKLKPEQKEQVSVEVNIEDIEKIEKKIGCVTEEEFNEENKPHDIQANISVEKCIECLPVEEFNEDKELKDLEDSLDNRKENVCGDVKVENSDLLHVGNTGEYGDSVDVSSVEMGSDNKTTQQELDNETDCFDFQINKLSESQTKIKPTLSACVLAGKAPPTTPTEEYFERRSQEDCLELMALKEKSNTAKEEKPKTEKKGTGKKITKLFMGACRKSASTFGEKTTTKTNTSSTVSSHTKRISESLHNLSTTLKSKSDGKKSDSSTRLIPRSTTNIPRNTVRSRTLLSKPSETNGLKKDSAKPAPKDAISLRSTSSTEKSITSKSSVHGSNKTLNSKTSNTSTKHVEKPSSTSLASKSKESVAVTQKLPRGTVASSLRQTEAHKRRNLFPNDDPEANIELSQFLFK